MGLPATAFIVVPVNHNRKVITMLDSSKRTIATLTAAACLGAGGWAMAATTNGSTTTTSGSTSTARTQQAPPQGQYGAPPAAQRTMDPKQGFPGEKALTGSDLASATTAAKAKLPGATIVRVETDVNDGATYEAHVTKSDGTQATVLMDKSFTVTSVLER